MFVVKEIVWAKVKNYPWWPAEVKLPERRETNCQPLSIIISKSLLSDKQIKKAVRKYLDHYEHLKSNTYKGLQNSIELANRELEKRKALIEESELKTKNMKTFDKGKKIKKNGKNNKRKFKGREKILKNSKPIENNLENECDNNEKVEIKNIVESSIEKPAEVQDQEEKSLVGSALLSEDCQGESDQFNEIEFMRSVDRKKIERTEEILFSYISKFNSNIFDKERECFEEIRKIESDDFRPEELIQSKITNMVTYLHKKLTERISSTTLKKQELESIFKIKQNLIEKAYNYLFDCSYYDQFIKRMEKSTSLNHIEKESNQKTEPLIFTKKCRKYKRKQTGKRIQSF